jgi:hypothetical protein
MIYQQARELVMLNITMPAKLELFKPILLGRILQAYKNSRKRRRLQW